MGSTHVVEQLSCSMFFSILTFDFDLILGSIFTFFGPQRDVFGVRVGLKTVLGSTHIVEQRSFCMLPSILTFYFDLFLGHF